LLVDSDWSTGIFLDLEDFRIWKVGVVLDGSNATGPNLFFFFFFFFLHSAIFLGDEGKIAENGFFLPDGGSRNGGNS